MVVCAARRSRSGVASHHDARAELRSCGRAEEYHRWQENATGWTYKTRHGRGARAAREDPLPPLPRTPPTHESSRNGRAGAPHASSRVTPQGPEGGVGHLQHCVEKRRENSCLVAFAKAPKALRPSDAHSFDEKQALRLLLAYHFYSLPFLLLLRLRLRTQPLGGRPLCAARRAEKNSDHGCPRGDPDDGE